MGGQGFLSGIKSDLTGLGDSFSDLFGIKKEEEEPFLRAAAPPSVGVSAPESVPPSLDVGGTEAPAVEPAQAPSTRAERRRARVPEELLSQFDRSLARGKDANTNPFRPPGAFRSVSDFMGITRRLIF